MKSIVRTKGLLLAVASLLLGACSMMNEQVTSIDQVQPDDVILVGKVVFNPPLTREEQHLSDAWNMSYAANQVAGKFFLRAGDNFDHIRTSTDRGGDYYDVKLGETYYITAKNTGPFYIAGGRFYTNLDNKNMETMNYTINSGIKVAISPKDKALYVGTITFTRDEFFKIKRVDISQDDYEREIPRFRKKFGSRLKLQKAKLGSAK